MRKFDGILFDIDGTLTSTNELIFASFRHIAKMFLHKEVTDEEIISNFGPPEDVILKKWCGDDYEAGRKEYYDFYAKNHNMADLYPGIKEILALIKSKDVLLAICTGKGSDAALITLKKLDIFKYFDFVITGDDVTKYKPSPEGINKFIQKFNLDKERVLMVGDAVTDILAARSAGAEMAAVVWDSYGKEEVLKVEGVKAFHTVAELKSFIAENIA
jgi:pyrophosphatase PpaX